MGILTNPKKLDNVVRNSGVSFRETSKSFIFQCPLCNKKDKLYMFKATGYFGCFKCREDKGFRGAPEYALSKLTGESIKDLRSQLYGIASEAASVKFVNICFSDFLEDDEEIEIDGEKFVEYPQTYWYYHHYTLDHKFAKNGVDYLAGRGVPKAIAMAYGARYSPQERRVCFPVTVRGQLVGWQARSIDDETEEKDGLVFKRLKIKSTWDLPKATVFMFEDRLANSPHAFLTEGPFDALKGHLVGGNICAMGKVVTEGQVAAILQSGVKRVYLGLDPDAYKELKPLLYKFQKAVEIFYCRPTEEDFGKMDMKDVPEIVFKHSKPLDLRKVIISFVD